MLHLFRRQDRKSPPRAERPLTVAPNVTARHHAGGAVFLHSGSGTVFSCNQVGARIWDALRGGRDVALLAAEFAGEYGVPVEVAADDAARFIAELEAAGMVRRTAA
jgi:hypothetical protein